MTSLEEINDTREMYKGEGKAAVVVCGWLYIHPFSLSSHSSVINDREDFFRTLLQRILNSFLEMSSAWARVESLA